MNSHGNPTLLLPPKDVAGQVIEIFTIDDKEIWSSHPLAAGRTAVCVDVREGRFIGLADGWSVLSPGTYIWRLALSKATFRSSTEVRGEEIKVTARKTVSSRFHHDSQNWFAQDVAWRSAGAWEIDQGTNASGLIPALSMESCSYLFLDFAMHGVIKAQFSPPSQGSSATWGLITRHYNAQNHLRLTMERKERSYKMILERFATGADPEFNQAVLDENRVLIESSYGELCWSFNGKRHEITLDGRVVLAANESYMGGVEIIGLFAEKNRSGNPANWRSFTAESSQWVAKHVINRGEYCAVVRAGNIHQLHLPLVAGTSPLNLNSKTNIFWESGLQTGHIGGSEIKFTQGSSLDMIAQGPVADGIRWRGPMPRFVDQDTDLRGYARGTATFYNDRIVVGDWIAVRVCRTVGPDFDLLGQVLSSAGRYATGNERDFHPWELLPDCTIHTVCSKKCDELFPVALLFPITIGSTHWHLIAAVGGLQNVDRIAHGKMFGWQCSTGLTASHNLRVLPTTPGTEYGFWIAISWLRTNNTKAAATAALHLRDEFQRPAALTAQRGSLVKNQPGCEQEAVRLALKGCFDPSRGFYRMQADRGVIKFVFDPLDISRYQPSFMVSGLDKDVLTCSIDGKKQQPGSEYLFQSWPAHSTETAILVQLLHNVTEPITVEMDSLGSI